METKRTEVLTDSARDRISAAKIKETELTNVNFFNCHSQKVSDEFV